MADTTETLYVKGHAFPLNKVSKGQRLAIRRMIRAELADDGDADAPTCLVCGSYKIAHVFTWQLVDDAAVEAATATVLMQAEDPTFTLEDALALTDEELYFKEVEAPPTKPARKASPRSSAKPKTPADSGSQS
jgi:hypothetical protein